MCKNILYFPDMGCVRTLRTLFVYATTAVSQFRAKTVQQIPLLTREVENRLPDCGVTH